MLFGYDRHLSFNSIAKACLDWEIVPLCLEERGGALGILKIVNDIKVFAVIPLVLLASRVALVVGPPVSVSLENSRSRLSKSDLAAYV